MKAKHLLPLLLACCAALGRAAETHSIARVWNEEILAAIRIDLPHPPVHARNLFHLSAAMYDAWAAYDGAAVGYLYRGKHTAPDLAAARREAVSHAAYRILSERYALSRNASNTLARLDARLASLGYDRNNRSTNAATPAGLGNLVAATASAFFLNDGSLQTNAYRDLPLSQGGYESVNPPLITHARSDLITDPNRWQPLAITNAQTQNELTADVIQKFLGAQWLGVGPFALTRENPLKPWIDFGPPPRLNSETDAQYRSECVEVLLRSSELDPSDNVMIDISPGAMGSNSLGANDGRGRDINPVTGLPYAPNRAKRADFARVLAEFWADGPSSETPPGHWNSIANEVSDDPRFVKRLGGEGPVLDDLEWDVKLYFTLNAAVHDAACAAWAVKRYYDGWRPIEAIRYMGHLGQSSDPNELYYHRNGLPLVPGLIEVTTVNSVKPGGRHEGAEFGRVVVRAWPGEPADPKTQTAGVRWVQAVDWLPYQRKTFVTPAFPGYVSGHSAFSRAAAEAMAAITGSPFFPGGLARVAAPPLTFEAGPAAPVELQWATYFDAADQAGLSRIWGGIHVSADDLTGRRIGAQCGIGAWRLARRYFDGSIAREPVTLAMRHLPGGGCELRYSTVRGFRYQLQFADEPSGVFANHPAGSLLATDIFAARRDDALQSRRFFRVIANPE